VTGKVIRSHVKQNGAAQPGDLIYLTKPLGVGLVTTAQKKGMATPEDLAEAREQMLHLNRIGMELAPLPHVHAMTDVTGFGLAGHVLEVLEASGTSARLDWENIPRMSFVERYLQMGTTPGGTERNWKSYGNRVDILSDEVDYRLLADPQTSGGLLMTVDPAFQSAFEDQLKERGYPLKPIGCIELESDSKLRVS
jgi:selenide,water dikinase